MAYPASTKTLAAWLGEIDSRASEVKFYAQQQKDMSLAGQLTVEVVRRFFDLLIGHHIFFTQAAAVPGIVQYARDEKGSPGLDPVAEFNAMMVQISATLDWLRANVPQSEFPPASGNFYKLGHKFPAGTSTVSTPLTFTANQTSAYRTQIDALLGTIA